ncbi:hypothetical protein [Flavobacterium oreochromis]|uniref:Uncharacterized protein n=1 Tax=Flavobacterium columnare TaxID=996 RepID=A0A246GDH4_9FLAO|nr:hypothetical protein [Flavobacterium oreochromis]OWP79357.1 hypothetical protein BWK62_02325 [Flavobacterium oreochromis]
MLIKLFSGKVILETKTEYTNHTLIIEKTGYYSLWVFGEFFTNPNLEKFNTKITDEKFKKILEIPALFRPTVTDVETGSLQLKYFYFKKVI